MILVGIVYIKFYIFTIKISQLIIKLHRNGDIFRAGFNVCLATATARL